MQDSKNQSISDNVSGNFSVIIKEKKRRFLINNGRFYMLDILFSVLSSMRDRKKKGEQLPDDARKLKIYFPYFLIHGQGEGGEV